MQNSFLKKNVGQRYAQVNGNPYSGKSATMRESNHGSDVCKKQYV